MRAPFQVLVIPYTRSGKSWRFAIFRRKDLGFWQAISGGGEGKEAPLQAAKREAFEETGISRSSKFTSLDSMTTIPIAHVGSYKWKSNVLVLPEHSFGVEVPTKKLTISKEHSRYAWLSYDQARKRLKYDSNKSALWELHFRLTKR